MRLVLPIGIALVSACLSMALFATTGCDHDYVPDVKFLPADRSDVLGFWRCRNAEGYMILDIRADGTYRQVCYRDGEEAAFFDSGWQAWEFKDGRPGDTSGLILCSNMMSHAGTGRKFDRVFKTSGIAVYKFPDGRVDFDRGWPGEFDWERLSREDLPPGYTVSNREGVGDD